MINLQKLYEGNITKNLIKFSIPLILSSLLSQTHSLVDSVMVSRIAGDSALAAIGSTEPLMTLVSSVIWGFGAGSTVYVAQLFGSGDNKGAVNAVKLVVLLSTAMCALISFLFVAFHDLVFSLLNISSFIEKDALTYYTIYSLGIILLQINWAGVYISNAFGMSSMAFTASVMSCVLNISANYILIAIAKLGVMGAAIGTVFSALCVTVYYIIRFRAVFKKLGCRLWGININKEDIKKACSLGLPNMLQQSVMYGSTTLISPLVNSAGPSAIAGYTAGMQIYELNAKIYQNSNKTITNYVAHCFGAKKYDMLSKGIRTGLVMAMCYLAIPLAFTVFASDFVSGIFFDSGSSPESLEYASIFMRWCMPFVLFNVVNNLFHAVFRGAGSGKYLVYATVVYALSRYVYSLALFPKFEMYGIFAAMVLSWITEVIYGTYVYIKGKWRNEI